MAHQKGSIDLTRFPNIHTFGFPSNSRTNDVNAF